jgi:hypothetical protein
MPLKVLTPEQLYDSLVAILGPPAKARGSTIGREPGHEFRQFFAGDGDPDPTPLRTRHSSSTPLMNSPQFAGRNVEALAARAQADESSAEEVVDRLFMTILSRPPTADEQRLVEAQFDGASAPSQAVYREVAWALLMSSEFSLNH